MLRKYMILIFVMTSLGLPMELFARVGVGIGIGKIVVNEELKAGSIHNLPSISVINKGDEASDYQLGIEYHEGVPELRPAREWFSFDPPIFRMEPGESRLVEVRLDLPIKTEPGDYFCYIEARPVKQVKSGGGARIGVAAGAKTYFTIAPANLWQGIYYKALSIWTYYAPWTYIVAIVIGLAILVVIFRRFFTFEIGIGRRGKKKDKKDKLSAEESLRKAMAGMRRYSRTLSTNAQAKILEEARRNRKKVSRFVGSGKASKARGLSPELVRFLKHMRSGLEKIKKENKRLFRKAKRELLDDLFD